MDPKQVQGTARYYTHCIQWLTVLILNLFADHSLASSTLLVPIENDTLQSIGEIRAISQGAQGFMWFAGSNGLARFDGHTVKLYLHDENDLSSISTNSTTDIMTSRDGKLWVATYWGLNCLDPATGKFHSYHHLPNNTNSPSHQSITSLLEDEHGNIWFGTDGGGLNILEPKTGKFTRMTTSDGLVNNSIIDLFLDNQGDIWVGFYHDGVARLSPASDKKPQQWTYFSDDSGFKGKEVFSISADSKNNIWVTGIGGTNQYERESNTFISYGKTADHNYQVHLDAIAAATDDEGNLWLGESGRALYRLDAGDQMIKLVTNTSSRIKSLFADRSGGLWVGTLSDGVFKVNPYARAFKSYERLPGEDNSLNNGNIISVAKDDADNLWAGTPTGFNYIDLKTDTITPYPFTEGQGRNRGPSVEAIAVDSKKRLWLGNSWWGLNRLDASTHTFTLFLTGSPGASNLQNRQIWSTLVDSEKKLWVGTSEGWLHRYDVDKEHFEAIAIDPNGSPNRVMVIFEDSYKGLWIGADNGLYHSPRPHSTQADFSQRKFRKYTREDSHEIAPSNSAIRAISQDSSGTMWFGSHGGGLYRWNKSRKSYKEYHLKDGLPHMSVSGILEDNTGMLWVSTGKGIARFNTNTEAFKVYDAHHGLAGSSFLSPASLKLESGQLVFGSSKGLNIIDPSAIFRNTRQPEVVITDFKLFNKSVTPGEVSEYSAEPILTKEITHTKSITLNHKESVYTFQFTALNYDIPENNQFSYKMEGFDKNWTHANTKRSATYTNLNAGKYVFRVRAANNEGVWNRKGAELAITILPPWWETMWAYAAYTLIILSALILTIRFQIRKRRLVERLNTELEIKVEERTQALSVEHERLKETQTELVKSRTMTSLSTLVSGVAHEINNPNNFTHVSIFNLQKHVEKFHAFLLQLAGDDADKELLSELQAFVDYFDSHFKSMTDGTLRIKSIVEDLKTFAHPESVDSQDVILHDAAQFCIDVIRPTANININFNVAVEKDLSIFCNPAQLNQALAAIITNSCQAFENTSNNDRHIKITANINENRAHITVADTGCGMNQTTLEHIFDPFYTTREIGSGVGLGLSIANSLIESMNGTIEIESTENEGTVVTISLPLGEG